VSQWSGPVASASAARVPRLSLRRERMERATKKGREGGSSCIGPRPVRPHRCASPDRRPRSAVKGGDDHGGGDREQRCHSRGSARDHPEFQAIIRRKALAELDTWIIRARSSLVAAFGNGVSKDRATIEAAIALSWSNGQTEGQICKLKFVKRQMYGRGNLDLLRARAIGLA
jgi:hypothetical protein